MVPQECHGAENAFETSEWVSRDDGATLENVVAALARHDDGVAAVGRFTGLAEVALELRERGFHFNQII